MNNGLTCFASQQRLSPALWVSRGRCVFAKRNVPAGDVAGN